MEVRGQIFYPWKKQFVDTGVREINRLKTLEHENPRLKPLITDLTLDKQILQDMVPTKLSGQPHAGRSCGRSSWRTRRANDTPAILREVEEEIGRLVEYYNKERYCKSLKKDNCGSVLWPATRHHNKKGTDQVDNSEPAETLHPDEHRRRITRTTNS